MAQSLGSLYVELKAETAGFVTGMSKASYEAKKTAKEIQGGFNQIGSSITAALEKTGPFGEAIASLGSGASGLFEGFSGAAGGISLAIGAIAGLAAAAIAAVGGLAAMAIAGADVVEHLSNLSAITGISTDELQNLQAAGATVGVSLDDLVQGTRKFDQAIAGVGKGAGVANIILRELGVTSKDPKEALLELADVFQQMPAGVDKSNVAVALFGKAGRELIPLLDKGRQGILDAGLAVDQYGARITGGGIKATEDYRVATEKLSLAWDGFKIRLGSGALPILTELIEKLSDATKGVGDFIAATLNHPGDVFDELFLYATPFADVAGNVNKTQAGRSPASGGGAKTNDAAAARRIADAQTLNTLYQKRYEIDAAGGAAAYALAQAREQIEGLVALERYQQADAIQQTIPALEKAVELAKAEAAAAARMLAVRMDILRVIATGRGFEGTISRGTSFRSHQSFATVDPNGPAPDIQPGEATDFLSKVLGKGGPQGLDVGKAAIQSFYDDWNKAAKGSADSINSTYDDEIAHFQGLAALGEISANQLADVTAKINAQRAAGLEQLRQDTGTSTFSDAFTSMFDKIANDGKDFARSLTADIGQALDGLNQQLAKFIATGKGLNIKKLGQGLEENLTSSILKKGESSLFGALGFGGGGKLGTAGNPMIVKNVDALSGALGAGGGAGGIASLFGGGSGGVGGILSKLPSIFGGFLAAGGDVSPGKINVVGENGPEFFVSQSQGRVAPSLKMSNGPAPVSLSFHVHGVTDSDSFKRSEAQTFSSLQQQLAIASSRSR